MEIPLELPAKSGNTFMPTPDYFRAWGRWLVSAIFQNRKRR